MRYVFALGLDFIIDTEGEVFLIEHHHGAFGLCGLRALFPEAYRRFRAARRALEGRLGRSPRVDAELDAVCSDKMWSFKACPDRCPSSHYFDGRIGPAREWARATPSRLVVAKPLDDSCGRGVVALPREALLDGDALARMSAPMILQEYVLSRLFPSAAGHHVGSIRHAVLLICDRAGLGFLHAPSYWRVAPRPFPADTVANISRGAEPVPVLDGEQVAIHDAAEDTGAALLRYVLRRSVPREKRWVVEPDGRVTKIV